MEAAFRVYFSAESAGVVCRFVFGEIRPIPQDHAVWESPVSVYENMLTQKKAGSFGSPGRYRQGS
jgi:hypothetical protein